MLPPGRTHPLRLSNPRTRTQRLLAIQPHSGIQFGMFQYIALAGDKPWTPGPYPGVELMVLHRNETTGGVVVLRKFHAGITVPAHTHPHANESVYVLSGQWEESGVTHGAGAFFFAPKGEQHGPHVARTEVISLTMFDGPLTVVGSSPPVR
jgi:anti-sigma factor ChrR (cupin superfamily)